MDGVLVATRALHFGAVILLFGEFVFVRFVWPARHLNPDFARVTSASLTIAFLSACAWLALEAVNMSGQPLLEAISPDTLSVVVLQTLFGRVWLLRIAIGALLGIVLIALVRSQGRRIDILRQLGGWLSLLLLISVAFTGHAVAGGGQGRLVHVGADMLHLMAAGSWLGALMPLVLLFHRTAGEATLRTLRFATQATYRFSNLGVAAISTLVLSGIVNSSYGVSDFQSLLRSAYGRLLVAKIGLFLLILALAAINRTVMTPRLAGGGSNVANRTRWLTRLKGSAVLELVLGFAVLAIVGALGITAPAAHLHPH